SAPALETRAVMAAVPADAGPLPRLPLGNTGTQFVADARDLVPWNARILNSRPRAFFGEQVTVADAARLHLDAHFSCTRSGNFPLNDLEIASRLRDLRRLHWCYCDSCSGHDDSFGFSTLVLKNSTTSFFLVNGCWRFLGRLSI